MWAMLEINKIDAKNAWNSSKNGLGSHKTRQKKISSFFGIIIKLLVKLNSLLTNKSVAQWGSR
jgi:hypothetical protein